MSAESPSKDAVASSSASAPKRVPLRACFKSTAPKKSGNGLMDEQNKAVFADLNDIIDHCCEHPEDMSVLRRKARDLQSDRVKRAVNNDGVSEFFENFGTVSQLDPVVISAWIVLNSDLGVEDLQKIKKEDSQGLHQLYSHATQLSLSLKLPEDLKNIEIFNAFSTERAAEVGKKIEFFKRDGGMSSTGALIFNDKIVTMAWEGDLLTEMVHKQSGTKSEFPRGTHITKEFEFRGFWCECDANLKIGSLPPIRLLQLFGTNPDFGYAMGANGKKHLAALTASVKPIAEKYRAKLRDLTAGQGSPSPSQKGNIARVLEEVAKEKRAQTAAGAREKALQSLAVTAKKRKLSLNRE